MAHYAFLNMQNIVTEVIVGKDETDGVINWEIHYGNIREQVCKRTSYNTYAGVHSLGGTPFRKNYAGVGFTYDQSRDAFIPPKPFDSWVLDEDSCLWEAPVEYPTDGNDYEWNEDNQSWDLIS
tara:strand:- start:646 stop:1014 length:369 start_codon:yes stop_codon:yes gene_type:complete